MQRTVQSTPLRSEPSVQVSYLIGAGLTQIGSFLTTYAFFAAVMSGAYFAVVLAVSGVVEFVLALGKSLLFRKRRDGVVGGASVFFDTLLNAGGIWPYARNLAASPPAVMIREAFALSGTISAITVFIIALAIGYLLAIAPHRLWRAARG